MSDLDEWGSAVADLSEADWTRYEDPQTYSDTHRLVIS